MMQHSSWVLSPAIGDKSASLIAPSRSYRTGHRWFRAKTMLRISSSWD